MPVNGGTSTQPASHSGGSLGYISQTAHQINNMRARHFASYASKGAYVKASKTFKSAATPNKEVSFFHCCNFDSYLIKQFMSNSINLHCWKMLKLHSQVQTKFSVEFLCFVVTLEVLKKAHLKPS